ncbi:MAG: toxin [Flavobacteriaceae bacterium CG_4_8_14_3_um_filter_34_10]|nr:toxin [Flavobacteriia bacterium]PIQ18371.1 MAG: toxin [Flavobacteriaceae bacterium CG18_big_fil_WC_8_21_14_2_50_34_36]PIV49163.1 MAG: toxin [Flavobacteriaceae bacterium CG02_land_8_20_14_3_00_34_13]PIX10590.1 MAG: toxin [Flavobacteriaceae bacterium CG_4_8_14_3_um_filter_34_10]PIZ08647.1 MAG: toxin [Flavobacteriaceae bacterium CG_4_10_14_0_8_um_filter_34_31]
MYEKRLRMFAGPNGSGKSTVYHSLKNEFDSGIYINSDDIEKSLSEFKSLKLSEYGISDEITPVSFTSFIQNHTLFHKAIKDGFDIDLTVENNIVLNKNLKTHSYEASILADLIRNQLIQIGKKLTFETVMSHFSKIDTLKQSKSQGYKNYLYFISTENVEINKIRVEERVKQGGHPVPVEKIVKRYYKSLTYLLEAIKYTHRTYIFDNSGKESKLVLDIYNGDLITFASNSIPVWVDKYILTSATSTDKA